MSDLIATGNAWLQGVRHQKLSQAVTYRSGVVQLAVQATIGRTEFESETAGGARLVTESRDFLIRVIDLATAGLPEPRRGDVVDELVAGVTFRYEVMPFGPQDEIWRYSDPYRLLYRVHTKFLSTIP